MENMKKYELIVIGSGPAGEKAAVKAAYFGRRVALIEKEPLFGGAGVNTGTLPSKTLKETTLYLSGKYEKGVYQLSRDLNREATIDDFLYRKKQVCSISAEEVRSNLLQHKVEIYAGTASFVDAYTLQVGNELLQADYILIATGSYPYHPPSIPFDGTRVHDSDTILNIQTLPKSLCIVGAGVIGCEYATIFANMGTKVYLINDKDHILSHIDEEICAELLKLMQATDIDIIFNTQVASLDLKDQIQITLNTGQVLHTDMFLFAAGRSGNTKDLKLDRIGITLGIRESLTVDAQFRTTIPHIYAVGDVIGFPALASTSMEQGRLAIAHMFQTQDLESLSSLLPYGIYTIPEVSMVGLTEEDLKKTEQPYCTGVAHYKDMARGRIMGAEFGFLKLIIERDSQQIVGVHIIGKQASEYIHYGMMLVKHKYTLQDVIKEVFNYPTLHDLYKYAAYDGLGNLSGHKIKG
jgi:NAD(P) transhydrogenase